MSDRHLTLRILIGCVAFVLVVVAIAVPCYYDSKGTRVLRDHCITARGDWFAGQCHFVGGKR